MSAAEQAIRAAKELGRKWRVCGHKWPSGEDRNPHECNQPHQHLSRHQCGCGVKG